jgi:hypothetical protein
VRTPESVHFTRKKCVYAVCMALVVWVMASDVAAVCWSCSCCLLHVNTLFAGIA